MRMMQWQIATWKETLNENFVLQRVKSSPAKCREQYLFWNLTRFSYAVFLISHLFPVHPLHSVLRIIMGKPSAAEFLLPLEKVWLWAAENLTGAQHLPPESAGGRRHEPDPSQTPQHHSQGGDRPGVCPSTSLNWVLKVALNPSI